MVGDAHAWSEMDAWSEMGPWAPKLEVSARAFLAGAFFAVKNRAPGPKVGVLGFVRSSQGRFFRQK